MSHMLRDISAPSRMRPFVAVCARGRIHSTLASIVYATAQTDRRWSRTLFPSRWIMAGRVVAISPDALLVSAYALRVNATAKDGSHGSMVRPTDRRCASTREFHGLRRLD